MSPRNWWEYTCGYKEAGDLLLGKALHGGRQHVLIYPIIFLYRHYIELQIKEIILNGSSYLGKSTKVPTIHNLEKLWEMCRGVLSEMDRDILEQLGEKERSKYEAYEAALGEDIRVFSQWDPNSEYFRYPIDKRGDNIVVNLKDIHLDKLQEQINKIEYELEGIGVGVYEYLSAKEEWLSYQYE